MLVDQIQQGESKKLEFKSQLVDKKKLAKTIVAFSNTAGGKFVIGVGDQGEIVGVDTVSVTGLIDQLANMIDDSCMPQIRPHIYTENIQGKILVVIEVFSGYQKPYYLKSEGIEQGVYVRVASTTRRADKETVRNLERTRENIGYDEEVNYQGARDGQGEKRFYEDFFYYTQKRIEEKDLINFKLLREVEGELLPTRAYGYFIIPQVQGEGVVKCARFKGETTSTFIDRKEVALPIYRQIEQVMAFAEMYIALGSKIVGARRIDQYAIPMAAIREAIANAVTHRDYSRQGANVTFNIFDDRVEITSPGELMGLLDIEQIKTGRSEIRNRTVARILKQMGFIEEWGTGVQRMISEAQAWGTRPPLFEEIGQSFRVTLYTA